MEESLELDGLRVSRTSGQHGTGKIAEAMAPVSGFVLRAEGEPTVYVAGDTIWCDDVRAAIDEHAPDVVVVNASGARFNEGDPIVMTADDVVATARHAAGHVVAVHLEAINHCLETRADLLARLREEGLGRQRARGRCRSASGPHDHGPMSPRPQPRIGQIGQK